MRCIPDTGASIDVISSKAAKKMGLEIIPDEQEEYSLLNAENNEIQIEGITKLTIQDPEGGWIETVALVCPDLGNNMLLSWMSQKKLSLLHKDWLFSKVETHERLKARKVSVKQHPTKSRSN